MLPFESVECEHDVGLMLRAVAFAAERHQDQRRKGHRRLPYINHPVRVAETLWTVGEVRDVVTLVAALLHDTLEDTATTPDEIEARFGPSVLSVVREVTDDKALSKAMRKQLQVEHAPHASSRAKAIKLADEIANVGDLTSEPPADWPPSRIREYVDWAEQVVVGLRGTNGPLEALYDEVVCAARVKYPAVDG